MTNKKIVIKRLAIYLLISFGLPFLIIFIYIYNNGWTVDNPYYYVISSVSMLCPAAANILTRILTKEGLENCFLKLRRGKNLKYFAIAALFPVVTGFIGAMISYVVLIPSPDLGKLFSSMDFKNLTLIILNCMAMSAVSFILGFGEEFGWRGYLTPKLEMLMPVPAAVFVSGVIWGLWHALIIACGHNFGTDYPGHPWVGIGLMCLSCVFIGAYLTALTKATGSAVTAGFAHMAINNTCTAVIIAILASVPGIEQEQPSGFDFSAVFILTISATAALTAAFIWLINSKTVNKQCTNNS